MNTNKLFGELLTAAIRKTAGEQNRSIQAVQIDLGDGLGYSESNIRRFRSGVVPKENEDIDYLVEYFISNGMDKEWGRRILKAVNYSESQIENFIRTKHILQLETPINKDHLETHLLHEKQKVNYLQQQEEEIIALLGSLYFDINISPIRADGFYEDELTDIEDVNFRLGGSGIWTGRYLWHVHGKKSYLFSVRGCKPDLFTDYLKSLLEREKINGEVQTANSSRWFYDHITLDENYKTASTFILEQEEPSITTMLTYMGPLSSFSWGQFKKNLLNVLGDGGILYISGYLKTNLKNGLIKHLEQLNENTLVCLDHGRVLHRNIRESDIQNIHVAFKRNLVDVYFCTCKEFWSLQSSEFIKQLDDKPLSTNDYFHEKVAEVGIRGFINQIIQHTTLPNITIIRDESYLGADSAYLIIDKRIIHLRNGHKRHKRGSNLSCSTFNAAFISFLTQKNSSLPSITSQKDLVPLKKLLIKGLDLDELHVLCFDLGIDIENFNIQQKELFIQNLLNYLSRRHSLDKLIRYLQKERSDMTDSLKSLHRINPQSNTNQNKSYFIDFLIEAGRFALGEWQVSAEYIHQFYEK